MSTPVTAASIMKWKMADAPKVSPSVPLAPAPLTAPGGSHDEIFGLPDSFTSPACALNNMR